MDKNYLQDSLQLPCGALIKNRLVKSAMTERISDAHLEPNERLYHLYRKWAATGAGLLITGNVIIDPVHLESAGNVHVRDTSMLPKMKLWAEAATSGGHHAWVQISHAGRQTNRFSTHQPLAPSEVQLHQLGLFGKPKAMSEEDIQQVINGFVKTAGLCKEAGFTGIQVHSAHGYLLSQFLSPNTNKRTDKWGGSLENRSRLLMTILDKIRQLVGAGFPISVKLNSSDFQRGGFTEEESLQVIQMLEGKIDLLEISGGTYEKLAFFGMDEAKEKVKESTRKREAYFMHFSKKVRAISSLPLLITGGFRSFDFCNQTLKNKELDLIGMARPFITNVDEIRDFIEGKASRLEDLSLRTGFKALDSAAEGGFYARQIIRLADGRGIKLQMSAIGSAVFLVYHELSMSLKNKFSSRQNKDG